MKIFLKTLFLFSIPCVLFLLFVEIYLRLLPTSYTGKVKGLVSVADSIQLIILGNSHATFGVDPNQMDLYAYNLAQVNQSLYFDKRLTLKYLDKLPKLKVVIITVDFHSLYFSSQGPRDAWSYYGNGIEYKDGLSLLNKYSRIMGYTPKVTVNLILKSLKKKYKTIKAVDVENGVNLSHPMTKGWLEYTGTHHSAMNESNYRERAQDFNELAKNSEEKMDVLKDLESFIQLLKFKNITPVLVTLPCYSPYANMLDKTIVAQNEDYLQTLSHKYAISYWNFLNLPLEEDKFWNCDHLNSEGAKIFSKILNQRITESSSERKAASIPSKEQDLVQ